MAMDLLDGSLLSQLSSRSNSVDGGDIDASFLAAAESMVRNGLGDGADGGGSTMSAAAAAAASGVGLGLGETGGRQQLQRRVLQQELGNQLEFMRHQTLQLERMLHSERERERDARALAWLRGRRVLFVMRTKKVLLGRDTKNSRVDMDLCEEGDAGRVSRRHAIISLKRNCEFYISNIGLRSLDINGKVGLPLLPPRPLRRCVRCCGRHRHRRRHRRRCCSCSDRLSFPRAAGAVWFRSHFDCSVPFCLSCK